MGAATRFIASAPAPSDHRSGNSPPAMFAIVMSFGRRRSSVPSMCCAQKRCLRRDRAYLTATIESLVEVYAHNDLQLHTRDDKRVLAGQLVSLAGSALTQRANASTAL